MKETRQIQAHDTSPLHRTQTAVTQESALPLEHSPPSTAGVNGETGAYGSWIALVWGPGRGDGYVLSALNYKLLQ